MSDVRTPSESWAGGSTGARRTGVSGGMAALIGAGLFCAGCLSGYLVGAGQNIAGFLAGAWEDPQAVVTVDAPEVIGSGETFDLVVRVRDVSNARRVVMDIDFEGAICEAFDVVSTDPVPMGEYSTYGYREMTFESAVAPGGEASFRWTLRAGEAGFQSGQVTAYLDDVFSSVSVPVTIEVAE